MFYNLPKTPKFTHFPSGLLCFAFQNNFEVQWQVLESAEQVGKVVGGGPYVIKQAIASWLEPTAGKGLPS